MRLFVAMPLPVGVRRELDERLRELLGRLSVNPVRWVNPDNWHLTLQFLGEVNADQLEALKGRLRGACCHFARLDLALAGFGCFPDFDKPRVVWVGVSAGSELMKLAESVRKATQEFGEETTGATPFQPHVTLGRVKEVSASQRREFGREFGHRQFGPAIPWVADSVVLMRSELGAGGATYFEEGQFPLKPGS